MVILLNLQLNLIYKLKLHLFKRQLIYHMGMKNILL